MAERTSIEWTSTAMPDGTVIPGSTFNPWRGCQHATLPDGTAHPGCDHCYAEAMSKRNPATLGIWGEGGTRVVAAETQWRLPIKWNAAAEKDGVRRKVFCASLADVFEDWRGPLVAKADPDDPTYLRVCVDTGEWVRSGAALTNVRLAKMDDVRRRLFSLIDATPWLDWLILTKRPENVRLMWPVPAASRMAINVQAGRGGSHRENVWLLTSVSDQASADAMVPALLECRDLVPVLGLSVEPLVGPVDLGPPERWSACSVRSGINWIIVGGESGPNARPCDIAWVRSIVAQCKAAGVPCFVKQLGARPVERYPSAWPNGYPHGERSVVLSGNGFGEFSVTGLCDKKGGDWNEWSEDLRIREFPCLL